MKTKKLITYESPSIEAKDSMIPESLLCASLTGGKIENYASEDEFYW